MSISKKFTFGLIWNLIGQSMIGFLGAIISILIARKLGKTELGIYASILTVPATIRLFTFLGFETILNLKLPILQAMEKGKEKMRYLIRKFLFYRLVVISIVAIFLYLVEPLLQKFFREINFSLYLPFIVFYLGTLMIFSYLTMIFRALLKIKIVSTIESINQFINLLLLILFFTLGFKVEGILSAFIIANIVSIFVLIYLGRDYIFGHTSTVNLYESYEIGAAAAFGAFISFGLGKQADIIIMNYFNVPSEKIGLYFLCFSLTSMMVLPLQGIGALSQSIFSEVYAKKATPGLAISWSKVTEVVVLFVIPLYAFAIFNAKIIIEVLYGNQFSEAALYFKIFAGFSCVSILVGSSFCSPVFYLLRRKKLALKIQFAGGILNIVLNIILIPKYGVWGVVVATGFSQSLAGIIKMLFVRHYIKVDFPLIFEIKILLACIIALIPVAFVNGSGLILILIKITIYSLGFAAILFLIKPLSEEAKAFVESADKRIFALVRFF